MFKTKEEIKNWLDKYNITNYTINDDLSVNVDGSVDLFYKNLTEIPIQFNKVNGYFWCNSNQLTSLKGSPKEVNGIFWCSKNQLTSLVGCPKEVGGHFICSDNKLTSLEGCPEKVNGYFDCDEHLKKTKEYNMYLINKRLSELA